MKVAPITCVIKETSSVNTLALEPTTDAPPVPRLDVNELCCPGGSILQGSYH
jgi:hypothetical protein